jgi:exonuclease VII large subunit
MTVAFLKKSMDQRFARLERRMRWQFASVDRRFESVDRRFESVDRRFDTVDKRFGDLEARVSARLDRRFESISDKLDSMAKSLDDNLKHNGRIIHEHEKRLTDLEASTRSH